MKKLFLASAIMFGFCALASAQTSEDLAAKKAAKKAEAAKTTTPAAVATPTISANTAATNDVQVSADGVVVAKDTKSDSRAKEAAVVAPAQKTDAQKAAPAPATRPKGKN